MEYLDNSMLITRSTQESSITYDCFIFNFKFATTSISQILTGNIILNSSRSKYNFLKIIKSRFHQI